VYPYYRIYQTKDGYISLGALAAKQSPERMQSIGIEDQYAYLDLGNGNDETYFYQKEVMKKLKTSLVRKPR